MLASAQPVNAVSEVLDCPLGAQILVSPFFGERCNLGVACYPQIVCEAASMQVANVVASVALGHLKIVAPSTETAAAILQGLVLRERTGTHATTGCLG